jgi:hypothetical protein
VKLLLGALVPLKVRVGRKVFGIKALGIRPAFRFRHQVQCPIRTWLCPLATFDRSDESPQWIARCCGGRTWVAWANAGAQQNTTGRAMKITVNLDCTPVEARQLMGLPDVQPLQAALLAEIEKKMMADLERFSPEGIARAWFSPLGGEQLSDAFGSWLRQAAPNAAKSSKS